MEHLTRRAAVLAVVVVVALAAELGPLSRWPGLPLLVALPPLDLFTDLRVLVSHAPGYPSLLLGIAAAVIDRSTVLALLGPPSRARFLPDGVDALSIVGIGDLAIEPGGWRIAGADVGCPVISEPPRPPPRSGDATTDLRLPPGDDLAPRPLWRRLVHPSSLPLGTVEGEHGYDHCGPTLMSRASP